MTQPRKIQLRWLPNEYSVVQLAADASVPTWVAGEFVSVSRTNDELSIVCETALVAETAVADHGWRCFRVAGKLNFSEVGILASISVPLSQANIPLFVVSTFDTDYVMLKRKDQSLAVQALENAGLHFET